MKDAEFDGAPFEDVARLGVIMPLRKKLFLLAPASCLK